MTNLSLTDVEGQKAWAEYRSPLAAEPTTKVGRALKENFLAGRQSALRELEAVKAEREWVSTSDRLPENPDPTRYNHVECYVFIGGRVEQLPWNCQHEVWDDSSGDDFLFEATEPSHWMKKPVKPAPPIQPEGTE